MPIAPIKGVFNMYVAISSGTAFDYAKTAQMKESLQKNKEKNKNPFVMSVEQKEAAAIAKRITEIKNKMKAGLRLSFEEKEFLRVNNTALYEKAIQIEKERDEHRRQLAKCKTKDEVRRVQLLKSSQQQTDFKNEDYETMQMRTMAISNENTIFTNTNEYKELPNSELEKENQENNGKKSEQKSGGIYQNAVETYLQNMQRSVNNINVKTNTEQNTEEPKIMTPRTSKNTRQGS